VSITAEVQVQFLLRIQRLLREGQFTATYKFALLMALADLSVELGDDSGARLSIDAEKIAEKFVEYYWRQTVPYAGRGTLSQNKGAMPVVINELLKLRTRYGDQLRFAQRDRAQWKQATKRIAATVRTMPLRYLQNVTQTDRIGFLYDPPVGAAPLVIQLYPGVAFCFRRFHGLIVELVQAAWTRWVQDQNIAIVGDQGDLHTFLFGASRASLLLLREPLARLQKNQCFYCGLELRQRFDVDHFVPWTLYQLDLGHNFVLAHSDCNNAKRDRLAAEKHLSVWVQRNRSDGPILSSEFDRLGILHNIDATRQIARWAYDSTASTSGLTWIRKQELVPLEGQWRSLLQ
jgi:HNH endonuclease